MDFAARIGLSTHFIPGIDVYEAVKGVREIGLRTFELVPSDYQGVMGNPFIVHQAGFWPRTFGKKDREKLRKAFSVFDDVTVHSPHQDINICSFNPGIKEESVRQYIEVTELAVDLGVKTLTYHPGKQSRAFCPREEMIRDNVEFAKRALEYAEKHDMMLGYEIVIPLDDLEEILDRVDSPRFGINFDIGHSVFEGRDGRATMPEIMANLERFADKVVEFHVHNVISRSDSVMNLLTGSDHRAIDKGNCLDYRQVVKWMKGKGFDVPMVLEIWGITAEDVFEDAKRSKDILVKYWNEA